MLSNAETPAQTSLAAPPDEEISLLELLTALARKRRLILLTTLGMIAVGVLLALLLPPYYTAVTAVLPPQQGSSAGSALLAQLGSLGGVASITGGSLGLKNPNDLQVAMMKSRTVEDAMVERFHLVHYYHVELHSQARKALERHVSIENGVTDGLIRISVTDREPRFAADMANGYVEEFKRNMAHLAVSEAAQRRLFFEQQLGQAKTNLADAEEALKKTQQQTGLIELDTQARSVISSVAQLRAQIAAKEVQIRAMHSFATGENPELQMAEEELAGLRAQELKIGASPDDVLIPRGSMQQAGLEYVRKLRDVKYFETIFDLLARQYEVAKVDEAKQGALVQVVDLAVVPDHRSGPKRLTILVVCTFLGLFLSTGWVLMKYALDRAGNNPVERARLQALKQCFLSPRGRVRL